MTCFKDLNDPTELDYGFKLYRSLIKHLHYYGCHQDFVMSHQSFLEADSKERLMEFFNFSCSQEIDLLGQWKEYGDHGRGICFEIVLNELENSNSLIGIVDYNYQSHVNHVKRTYKIFTEHLIKESKRKNIQDVLYSREFALALFQSQYASSSFMKHNGWKEENEIRLINLRSALDKDIVILGGKRRIRKKIDLEVITKVMWGPRVTQEEIDETTKTYSDFFNKTYHSNSKIPWR
ncbi:MAG: DUF2971 domain-containing protein [Flavobacterium sp.]